jgi:hypothetical protein
MSAVRSSSTISSTRGRPGSASLGRKSTFGGKPGLGNSCANGGALSSIGVSWNILNSVLSESTAVGHGANSGQGGNGGAIYNDGNEIVLHVTGA